MADQPEDTMFALVEDDLFGKLDEELNLRIATPLKEGLRKKAAAAGMTMGAYARLLFAINVFGADHVGSLMARRLAVVTANVGTSAPQEATHG